MKSRLRRSPVRRFEPTVVFIHHYGGNYVSTHRHQDLVLKLGFDCYSFDLSNNKLPKWDGFIPEGVNRFGHSVVEKWADELGEALDRIEGRKIIYSFSFPSVALPALLARGPRPDVCAWITDGGPFLEMFRSEWRLFAFELPNVSVFKRAALTVMSYLILGGPLYPVKVRRWVRALPLTLPILSLRGGKDRLVPTRAIDKLFAANPALKLQRLVLPLAGHLEGLKESPDEYRRAVEGFLAANVEE